MGVLGRLLRTHGRDRSEQSDVLAAHATGIAPALLDATAPEAPSPDLVAVADAPAGRRGRGLDRAEDVLTDQVAQKVLGYWLQNRHQTLFPLIVNLRNLGPDAAELLAQWSASALLAAAPGDTDARTETRRWLAGVGADDLALEAFDAAFGAAPSIGTLLLSIAARPGFSGTAYVAALVALGQREPAARFFLEFVAARLGLPSTVVRSASRRFGR